ncbi:10667_t:CDS:2, partial [Cetraspora pellucida]
MDSNSEYISEIDRISDNDIQKIVESSSITRRKAVDKPVEEPSVKKIRVNLSKPPSSSRKSYVWKYFEEVGENDVCKIVVFRKGEEVECDMSYKHDGSTGNMKTHLRSAHKVFRADESLSSNEKQQLSINDMIRQVRPHSTSKQLELQRVTAEWLVTDSLAFNVVCGKGYHEELLNEDFSNEELDNNIESQFSPK